MKNFKDLSVEGHLDEWNSFLGWIDSRIDESGAFEIRKEWSKARNEYLAANSKITGVFRLCLSLLKTGHPIELISQKIFGSSLPKQLSKEWIAKQKKLKVYI